MAHSATKPMAARTVVDDDPFDRTALAAGARPEDAFRETAGMVWLSRYNLWATARYDEVGEILDDFKNFSSADRPFSSPDFPLPQILVTDDPPGHTRIRTVMNRIFNPKVLRRYEHDFAACAATLIDQMVHAETFDGVTDLVTPYILRVFGDMVGIRPDDRNFLIPFGAATLNTFGPVNDLFHELAHAGVEATDWVHSQCERASLSEDGMGAALYACVDSGEINEQEAWLLVLTLLSAGVDTTISSLVNLLHALAQHPDQFEALRTDPGLAERTFEESLRFHSPARVFGRVAVADVEVSGARIRKGEGMLVFLGAAGRDRRAWPDAAEFNVRRPTGKHMSFGKGIHNCVGQMLTRAEARAFVRALATQVKRIDLVGSPEPLISNTIDSFARLPMRFSA